MFVQKYILMALSLSCKCDKSLLKWSASRTHTFVDSLDVA
jgi:hypothetical protein